MIPKKLHYCWFGRGEKPKLVKKCIDSWKRLCPDYEIIEWNEDNFDINLNPYIRYCYNKKRWAFLSDLVRLIVVYENGGIYLDTDVELIKSLDGLLENHAFYAFENDRFVASGLGFGAEKGNATLKAMIEEYSDFTPELEDEFQFIGCPTLNTKALLRMGLKLDGKKQIVNGALILPTEYMNPYDDATGRLNTTVNTVSIHWYAKSALDKKTILRSKITQKIHRVFGVNSLEWLKRK